jgi:hypothetical protein
VKEKMCCKRRAGDVCVCHLAMVWWRDYTTELGGFSVLLLYTGASFETRRSVSSLNTWSPKQHGTRQKKGEMNRFGRAWRGTSALLSFFPIQIIFQMVKWRRLCFVVLLLCWQHWWDDIDEGTITQPNNTNNKNQTI